MVTFELLISYTAVLIAFGGLMYLCFITIPEFMEKRAAQH